MSDSSGILCPMSARPNAEEAAAAARVADKLDGAPLTILFRIRNNRADYSILNRPEPTLSGVSDAVLMAALLCAGKSYTFKRAASVADDERIERTDGKAVTYKESIEIDFEMKAIEGSMPRDTVLTVLSIVVQNLARGVAQHAARHTRGVN